MQSTWVYECDTKLSAISESSPATVVSWAALEGLRREFLSRLNSIRRNLVSVDQTTAELRRMDVSRFAGHRLAANARVREFVRNLLLSGNGGLVFNNSFVQRGASETLRGVEPQVLVACFGNRPKLKPFSSTVLFDDQTRSNPVADADDPAGSIVDALKLSTYVYLAAQRVPCYQDGTVTIMVAAGSSRMLVLGAPVPARHTGDGVKAFALDWVRG